MIARSALPFMLRSMIDRVGFASATQRDGRGRRWHHVIAALEDWWTTSYLAWRSEIPSGAHAEGFRRFCRDCGEDTPHEGSDEFGFGWYAQIYRCRYCGGQGMRIWPLA
jgi:hypothetical protein